jgi:hypothetical protein
MEATSDLKLNLPVVAKLASESDILSKAFVKSVADCPATSAA